MSTSLELAKILAERNREKKNMLENLANVGKGVQGAAQELWCAACLVDTEF